MSIEERNSLILASARLLENANNDPDNHALDVRPLSYYYYLKQQDLSYYEVVSGDTLTSIAWALTEDPHRFRELYELNPTLKTDIYIYPGQRITLPLAWVEKQKSIKLKKIYAALLSNDPAPIATRDLIKKPKMTRMLKITSPNNKTLLVVDLENVRMVRRCVIKNSVFSFQVFMTDIDPVLFTVAEHPNAEEMYNMLSDAFYEYHNKPQ